MVSICVRIGNSVARRIISEAAYAAFFIRNLYQPVQAVVDVGSLTSKRICLENQISAAIVGKGGLAAVCIRDGDDLSSVVILIRGLVTQRIRDLCQSVLGIIGVCILISLCVRDLRTVSVCVIRIGCLPAVRSRSFGYTPCIVVAVSGPSASLLHRITYPTVSENKRTKRKGISIKSH